MNNLKEKTELFFPSQIYMANRNLKCFFEVIAKKKTLTPNTFSFFSQLSNLRLQGGGKKRKKKNFTKPKKNKHIRKKIKLRFLGYYSIVEGKIQKLRKNSPDSSGCFMAEHHDRLSCGKTGLTYTRK